jgi:hypothetical protein
MTWCARRTGHSVVICQCRTAAGFLPCPDDMQGPLTPTYPPAAYERAREALRAEAVPPPRQPTGDVAGFDRRVSLRPPPADDAALRAPPPRSAPRLVYSGGYTGSICDQCGSTRMRRSGTCETCEDCGSAGGCG